jgi:hypothetical protein
MQLHNRARSIRVIPDQGSVEAPLAVNLYAALYRDTQFFASLKDEGPGDAWKEILTLRKDCILRQNPVMAVAQNGGRSHLHLEMASVPSIAEWFAKDPVAPIEFTGNL